MRQQNQELTHVKHEFDPIFDENSEILILGTLPSVKSREQNFYYKLALFSFFYICYASGNMTNI